MKHLTLAAILILSGCVGSRTMELKIVSSIRECPDPVKCRVKLADLTNFDWDRMYAFKYVATKLDRELALGTKDQEFTELERQIVFVKDGRIVFQESEATNVEHPIKNEVIFDIPDDATSKSYVHGVVFSAIEKRGEDGPYFLLKQVEP